ncbi:sister chromatid cohesion protein PDS5 [Nodosilinea sp. PGN35]|uniref:sister chromatid cohesion protein PDS5 n=1 Tax=Nodosilinea sp. PGN35 TaxID=3020489 RepID=UPI0023B2AE8E|nr:sister chromatid cohesion protein PDS5 [Nodosilinea sp. TSF1-S3]MDF0366811.1 HEAT repeat domain-containing protein [Nodosilinea sp. TSF1-S3]
MVVELLTPVATWALGKAADTIWTLATDRAQTTLQKTDIEQAIKAGLEAVRAWEQSLEVSARLLKRCDDKQEPQFLEQVFANAGVAEQLQRPLVGKGEPDVGLLRAYVEQVAKDEGIELTIESLPRWLQIFSATYVEKTALFTKYWVTRQRYLEQLTNWHDDVKFLGISVAGQEDTKSEKLLKIFVMPDVKQRPDSRQKELDGEFAFNVRDYLGDSRQSGLMEEQRRLTSLLKQEGKTFSAKALLQQSQSQRFVLLGAPGSGKTILMSYFAIAFATEGTPITLGLTSEYLPILVRISHWDQSAHTNLMDYVRWFTTDKLNVKGLPTGFFEHWLEAGKALILLDGLDEVATESRRDEVVNQIESFLQHDAYRHNSAIITSRPAGYKQAYFRTEEFPHYDLQPFDQAKIDQFIQNWYDNRFRDREESQRRQRTLKQALSERDRIQVLAKNPLLLTLIALIHRQNAYLPRKRHELYNRAVETLLTSWDANKNLDYKWPLEYLKHDAVRRMMERLAYWIHRYGSTGDAEGGTLIDREELIRKLSHFIAKKTKIDREEATAEAKRFLDYIRSRTGLLNEQGQDCYAFVHKTFQEYLCAQEIQEQSADEDYNFDLILSPIRDHLHNPHWEEVLLLMIAQQREIRVAKILQQILDHPAPYEQWLHRNLFFAAACLSENVELTDIPLIDRILDPLMELAVESPLIASRLRQEAHKCLRNLSETSFQDLTLQRLEEAKYSKINPVHIQRIRFALGQVTSATNSLVTLLSDADSRVRALAVMALGNLAQASPEVLSSLIQCLSDDSINVRYSAVSALGDLAQASPDVLQALIRSLSDDSNIIRSSATSALGKLARTSPDVLQALIQCLSDDDSSVRYSAASALGKLAQVSPKALQALIQCLSDDDSSVRSSAASALGKLAQVSPEVLQALIQCLSDDDSSVRSSAASALGQLTQAFPEVLSSLIQCLSDDDNSVRYSAASALGKLAQASPEVLQALIQCLSDDDSSVRSSAASALSKLAQASPEVLKVLMEGLSDNDSSIRSSAASALGQLTQASPEVVTALIDCLSDDDSIVRYGAASALGNHAQASPEALQALIQCLSNDDSFVRALAALDLGNLAQDSSEALQALMQCLSNDDYLVRSTAVSVLSQMGKQTDTIASQLANWIEQNQQSDYVGHGIDALWAIMTEQS